MKYLITESQIDDLIFRYLDNQDFKIVDTQKRIYFLDYVDNPYSQIRYDKDDGFCYINAKLINELNEFFSFEKSDVQQFIVRWIEKYLKRKIRGSARANLPDNVRLRVPNLKYI